MVGCQKEPFCFTADHPPFDVYLRGIKRVSVCSVSPVCVPLEPAEARGWTRAASTVDLPTGELRDEYRGIHRAFLPGEVAEPFQKSALDRYRRAEMTYFSSGVAAFAFALSLPFSLSVASAFFASVAICFFIALLL